MPSLSETQSSINIGLLYFGVLYKAASLAICIKPCQRSTEMEVRALGDFVVAFDFSGFI